MTSRRYGGEKAVSPDWLMPSSPAKLALWGNVRDFQI
jgi:hypothetical protein